MKLVFTVCSIFVFAFAVAAQTEEADKLSAEVVKLYSAKKYTEALGPAEKAVAVFAESPGKTSLLYGQAVRNLAFVQLGLGQNREALGNLETAVGVYSRQQTLARSSKIELAQMLELVATSEYNAARREKAEKLFTAALKIRDEGGPANDATTDRTLFALANLARFRRDSVNAENLAKRAYEARANSPRSADMFELGNLYGCMAERNGNFDAADAFMKEIGQRRPPAPVADASRAPKYVNFGVINGRATVLAMQSYPIGASATGARGEVWVRVVVDESGKVVWACGTKGSPSLFDSSETAAFASSFPPTQIRGTPVTVIGYLVYNYRP